MTSDDKDIDLTNAIVTRPGENIVSTVEAARGRAHCKRVRLTIDITFKRAPRMSDGEAERLAERLADNARQDWFSNDRIESVYVRGGTIVPPDLDAPRVFVANDDGTFTCDDCIPDDLDLGDDTVQIWEEESDGWVEPVDPCCKCGKEIPVFIGKESDDE